MSELPRRASFFFSVVAFSCAAAAAQVQTGTTGAQQAARLPRAPRGSFVECTRLIHTFLGEATGDQFGWVSSPLPDLDGDAIQDVVVTAPFHDSGGSNVGRVYVYSGATGKELFQVTGVNANWQMGYSAREAGDVNADGTCDIVVGAPFTSQRGRVRVYSGRPEDDGLLLFTQKLGNVGDALGASVTGLGDIDGDGFGDVAVGADRDDTTGIDAGKVYLLSGGDGGVTILWTAEGEAASDNFGTSLGRLPDVTGDGKDELIVGANDGGPGNRGRAYVYDVANDVLLYTMEPDTTGVDFGTFFVASPGDVNGNGSPDVYVADFSDSSKGTGTGKAYVFEGLDGSLIGVFEGADAGDGFGIGRGVGDVDADGFDDLLLCGYLDSDGAPTAGKAEVFSGRDLSLFQTATVLQTITSKTAGENLGFDAHGIGDVDGDGELDFFITAAGNSEVGNNAGKCYVVAGGSPIAHVQGGVAGSGGLEPLVDTLMCPRLGRVVSVEVTQGLGAASGAIFYGETPTAVPAAGALLLVEPLLLIPHTLAGQAGVAGAGTASFDVPMGIDVSQLGLPVLLQAFYFDPGAPAGLSVSDALRLERVQFP